MGFVPQNDGIDHINIYSKGKTELGRMLTNMYWMDPPVKMGHHGPFRTIEGWWYYVKISQLLGDKYWERRDTVLFDLQVGTGFQVKKLGREILKEVPASKLKKWDSEKHRNMMIVAFRAKLKAIPRLAELLKQNTLPLAHYYVYGEGEKAVRRDANPDHDWQLQVWSTLGRGI